MTSRTRLIVLLVSAPLIAFVLIGALLGRVIAREGTTFQHLRVFEDVVSLVMSNYVEEVNSEKVMHGAMRGLAEGLDPDSAWLSPEELRAYQKGPAAGQADIGIELTRQYYLRVIAARDGSPAVKVGLRPGDFVRAIDGKPTREMSVYEGARLLRGEPGTKVTLIVIRSNAAEPHSIEVAREIRRPLPVTGRVLANGVGYVRIPEFGPQVVEQVRSQIAGLTQSGATSLALDIRDSVAGDLENGFAVARLFVPSGTLGFREARGTPRQPVMADAGDKAIALPAVVLVDAGTSGAAELFAAALAGNKRAELIGERTHGRAARQKLVPLPDGSGLLISNAWYLTPAATAIHEKGLSPDSAVEEPEVDFGAPPPTTDPILDKAVERLAARRAA
jgi:carboxyl-terminal processing protease